MGKPEKSLTSFNMVSCSLYNVFVILVTVLLMLILPTEESKEVHTIRNCPSNYQVWEETSKYCYKIFTRKLNWTEAESNCRKFGGNLISISSSSISDAVKKQMKNQEL